MPYFVKKCTRCATLNHPDDTTCSKCGEYLPTEKTESPAKPPLSAAARQAELEHNAIEARRGAEPKAVRVAGFDMPFWDMVWFMVKVAFAAIPAIATVIGINTVLLKIINAISDALGG